MWSKRVHQRQPIPWPKPLVRNEKTVRPGHERTLRIIALVVLVFVLLGVAYELSSIFNPLLIALLLAYISDPLISRLEKVFKHRLAAIVSIYIYLLILFILIPALVMGRFYSESSSLALTLFGEASTDLNLNGKWDPGEFYTDLNGDRIPQPNELFNDTNRNGKFDSFENGYIYKVLDRIKVYGRSYDAESYFRKAIDIDEAVGYIKDNLRQIATASTRATGWFFTTVALSIQEVFAYLSFVVLIPIYTFFFLYEWNDIKRTFALYLPGLYRDRIVDIVSKIDRAVSSFFRGRLIICIIKSLLTALGLWICGIRFAFFIGLIAGFLSFIPFLGIIIGAIPSVTFVIMDHHGSILIFIGVAIVFALVEALEGVVLTPWILGKETGLHPITLILSFMVFGKLLGLFGLLMAVPLTAIVKILGKEFLLPIIEEFAQERGSPESSHSDGSASHDSASDDSASHGSASGKTSKSKKA